VGPVEIPYPQPLPRARGKGSRPAPSPLPPRTGRGWGVGDLLIPIALAGLIALLAYLAGTPFTVLDFPKWRADFLTQASFVDELWEGQTRLLPGVPYLLGLGAGMGSVMFALSLFGAGVLLKRCPSIGVVLIAFPLAYFLFMLRSQLFFVRFALPVVPFLCLLAAVAVVAVVKTIAGHRSALAAPYAGMLIIAAVAQPTFDTVRHNQLIAKEDTRVLAAEWALANVPPGAKLAVEEYTIRDRRPRSYGGPVWKLDTDLLDVNQLRRADRWRLCAARPATSWCRASSRIGSQAAQTRRSASSTTLWRSRGGS